MNNKELTRKSKFISLILRHKPDVAGIELDKNGWASTKELVKAVGITMDELEYIVQTDEKGRYAFNSDKSKIRANQGHSIDVDVELEKLDIVPSVLYHGTTWKNVDSIMKSGLNSGSRKYVHLSPDSDTAIKVGKRHGNPVVLEIDSHKMSVDGIIIYKSANGVYLTDSVPAKYIRVSREVGEV